MLRKYKERAGAYRIRFVVWYVYVYDFDMSYMSLLMLCIHEVIRRDYGDYKWGGVQVMGRHLTLLCTMHYFTKVTKEFSLLKRE